MSVSLSLTPPFASVRTTEGAPFDEVVRAGCIPTIVALVRDSDHVEAQYEAAWILTNCLFFPPPSHAHHKHTHMR